MTPRTPSSCVRTVLSLKLQHHRQKAIPFIHHHFVTRIQLIRHHNYATQSTSKPHSRRPLPQIPSQDHAAQLYPPPKDSSHDGAYTATDNINPPTSTLPPPLHLPTRASYPSTLTYYFRLGAAYATFYKSGLKSVWHNHQTARRLKSRIAYPETPLQAALSGRLSRADLHVLLRSANDMRKLPFFAVLVLVFGEWLPLLVPFFPRAVPVPCRIPQQILQMRTKTEQRRRDSFRVGVLEPSNLPPSPSGDSWPILSLQNLNRLLLPLTAPQLRHLATTLDLHPRIPIFLRRRLSTRLHILAIDDHLLATATKVGGIDVLTLDELLLACESRGLDTLGVPEARLRRDLAGWIARQERDRGGGGMMMRMLFRR
ncbi:hypothetical protein M433DRAFT_153295 [Acidomyces richmondensis BFW]|nr:MAG: hypothetical protein FE78DRAFT_88915 [Acidomyces sp. 'richmondensis']KYG46493.1 hypothetical protein M433DRAFT_153295 [Acidomyces richmondensis BFW]